MALLQVGKNRPRSLSSDIPQFAIIEDMQTRRVVLASIPKGTPQPSDFRIETVESPTCPVDGVLVRTTYISVDPYLRGRISGVRSYVDPIPVGSPMVSGAVGEILESKAEGFSPGDIVTGFWDWQEIVA